MGDRVLIRLEEGEERSKVGLYLPATAVDNQAVQGGTIVATPSSFVVPAAQERTVTCSWVGNSRSYRSRRTMSIAASILVLPELAIAISS